MSLLASGYQPAQRHPAKERPPAQRQFRHLMNDRLAFATAALVPFPERISRRQNTSRRCHFGIQEDAGADFNAFVQILHMFIRQPRASIDTATQLFRGVRSMNAKIGIASLGIVEIERAGPRKGPPFSPSLYFAYLCGSRRIMAFVAATMAIWPCALP